MDARCTRSAIPGLAPGRGPADRTHLDRRRRVRFLAERTERIVVVYHNITPPEYFRRTTRSSRACSSRARGPRRPPGPHPLAIAVSEYNAEELDDAGYPDVRVVPLVVDPYRLRSVAADPTEDRGSRPRPGPVVLFVGQVLPHKRHELLLEAFHVLITQLLPEASLVLAGPARLPAYEQTLRRLRRELGLANVGFTGSISPEELVAYYRGAAAFVTASDHEGLCIPVLEAMAFDLPVVARAPRRSPRRSATPGILLPAESDPLLLAEAMAAVIGSAELGDELGRAAGAARRTSTPTTPAPRSSTPCSRWPDRAALLFVVQRYGAEVLGGAERATPRLRDPYGGTRPPRRGRHQSGHQLRRLGRRLPGGYERDERGRRAPLPGAGAAGPSLLRPAARPRRWGRPHPAYLVQRIWMRMQGPDLPELPGWLREHASRFDVVIFFTYLYPPTAVGLDAVAGVVPTVLHPLAHDEPPLRLALFDPIFRLADAFAFLTEEEETLVERRFGLHRPSTSPASASTSRRPTAGPRRRRLPERPSASATVRTCCTSDGSTRARARSSSPTLCRVRDRQRRPGTPARAPRRAVSELSRRPESS